ncbi:hypothetical protein [Bradyrhizobium ottawaense]|uniref:hypothetical protein n=1 Tax=Bradyrhizobium ottawaense TaxID=931866 RepID=UPI003FA0C3C2
MSGFDDFLIATKRYRNFLVWIVGASIALPVAAYQVDLTPPWPRGVVLLTAIWQAVAIVASFQFAHRLSRKSANRALAWSISATMFFGLAYGVALSQLTFEGGPAKERLVKGLVCTNEAKKLEVYRDACPLLSDKLINGAETTQELWTPSSITSSRIILLSLWLLFYLPFALSVALFVVFQSGQQSRFRIRP